MVIHCLRHGITEGNLLGCFNGSNDDRLTERQRVAFLAVQFNSTRYQAIYCSPLRRAIETAECLRIPDWISEPRIAERNLGIFEGLTASDCRARFAEEFSRFQAFDADFAIPKGESRAQNLGRVLSWVEEVSGFDTVLAITHGGTIDFLYRIGTGLPLHGGDKIYSGSNAAISSFEVSWPKIHLVNYDVSLNATGDT